MDFPRSILLIQAKRQLGYFDTQELVDWAVAALQTGYETEHLLMLAGMDGYPSQEKWDYFERSVAELGLPLPPPDKEALRAYATVRAEEVVAGRLDWRAGLSEFVKICRASRYAPRYDYFSYLSDELDMIEDGVGIGQYVANLTQANAPDVVRQAFNHFLAGEALGIDPWQWGKVYCYACGEIAPPAHRPNWFARLLSQSGKEVCWVCGSEGIGHFDDDAERGEILDALRGGGLPDK